MKIVRRRALIPILLGQSGYFAPALERDRTLVVFVHGFRGKALSTWLSFQNLVDGFDGLRNADILFYGYASKPQRMQNMAINMKAHIDSVWANPGILGPEALFALGRQDAKHVWSRVLFVAHSFGAVVVRRALLDCCLENTGRYDEEHWSRRAALCLFAPAHSGANVLQLINETSSGFGVPIGPILKLIYPCLQDINAESRALDALQEDYQNLPEQQRNLLNAVSVILAENDRVVDPARFPGDPVPDQISGCGHIDVCKPSLEFLDPVIKLSAIWKISSRFTARGIEKEE